MHSLLQKKSFVIVILALIVMSCLVFFNIPYKASVEASGTVENFYQFEDKFLDLASEQEYDENSEDVVKIRSIDGEEKGDNSTFHLKRLIVLGEISNYYGASGVVNGYKNYNILFFDTEQDTAYAYEQLSKQDDVIVIIDEEIHISDYADNQYTYPTNGTWGAEAMNVGGINDYLTTNGTDEEVVVAVLDTGIRPTHIFFRNRLLEKNGQVVGYSYYQPTNQVQYSFEDDNGHGSHVSGIITQLTPENVKILPIKVMNNEGSGTFSVFILGLERILEVYSQQYNICCINMSLGGDADKSVSEQLNNIFEQLKDEEILSVVSAGNDQLDTDNYMPANCESAIVVSALKEEDNVYTFDHSYSNFGSTIDIAAPGSDIYSAYYLSDNVAAYMSGTSMASPHVSAAIALLCCDEIYWNGSSPTYTDEVIEQRLYENTVDLGDQGWDEFYGYGMVDLKYFNVDLSKDVLTFYDGNNQAIDISNYIEFNGSYELKVIAPDSNYQIYYTTDGTIPTRESTKYTSTLTITNSNIYYFMGYRVTNGSISQSSILYKVDLFNPNDDIDDFFVNNNGVLVYYTGHFKQLEIPSTVDGISVLQLGIRLFDNNEIESLTLPASCTKLGEYCFSGCVNLKSIEFSNVNYIASYAFQNCQSLTDINLDSVERLGEKTETAILGHSFENCKSLNEIYFPKLITIGDSTFFGSTVTMVAIGKNFETSYGEGVGENIIIYGYKNSTAESYCDKYGNNFVAIDDFSLASNLPTTKKIQRGTIDTLQITAKGLKLSYQWYKTPNTTLNGTPISGETNSTLKINSALLGTTKYFVKVTDWEGNSINSAICTVTVVTNGLNSVAQIYTISGWEFYETIADAIDSSVDDDVIIVTKDCYLDRLTTIDHNLTIISVNNATVSVDEKLLNTSQPIITVQNGKTLTFGYDLASYQGLNVTPLYVDGQSQNGSVDTFVKLLSNASLNVKSNSQIQNFNANKIIDGESGSSLDIDGGIITNNTGNFTGNNNYLITAGNITLSNYCEISNNNAKSGAIIYVNNSTLNINNATFVENSADYIISSNLNAQITVSDGNFENNTCNALICYYVSSEQDNLSSLNLLGGNSQNNSPLNIADYYDIYITDENLTSGYTYSQKSISIGANCNFESFYLNNTVEAIALTVVEDLSSSQKFYIDVLDADSYANNPIVIFEAGLNVNSSYFNNEVYDFVTKDGIGQQNYLFLQEKPEYIFTYVISQNSSEQQSYKAGEKIVKIEDPTSEKYDFAGWYAEPQCINEYVFDVMPNRDVTVYAKWDIKTFVIVAMSGANGQISPSGQVSINYGDSQKFIFTPNQGYCVSKITVDGIVLQDTDLKNAITNGYTFSNVTKDHEIYAEFQIQTFTITAQSNGYGTITPQGETSYRYGQNATYYITPNQGYHISYIVIDNIPVNESNFENILKNGYTFNNIASSHAINVGFSINIYTITATSYGNGDISPKGELEVEHGQSQTYYFLPNVGYCVSMIEIDGELLSTSEVENLQENGYTFNNVDQDHTIIVRFEIATYTITYDLNYDNEFVNQDYKYNSQIDEFVPTRKGYNFVGWYKDSSLQEKYVFTIMPANDLTVYAKWSIILYTINATTNGNGTITPNGEIEKEFNSSVTYKFTPNEGYYLSSVLVDGKSLTNNQLAQAQLRGYTLSNIDSEHNIQATFEICKFEISVKIEGDGKFYSNQDIGSVNYGENRTFTIDTDFDKNKVEVYINGELVEQNANKQLEIDDIKQDLSVTVKFIEKPFLETNTGKIIVIVSCVTLGLIIFAIPVLHFTRRRRLYSNMNK